MLWQRRKLTQGESLGDNFNRLAESRTLISPIRFQGIELVSLPLGKDTVNADLRPIDQVIQSR